MNIRSKPQRTRLGLGDQVSGVSYAPLSSASLVNQEFIEFTVAIDEACNLTLLYVLSSGCIFDTFSMYAVCI